MHLKDMSYFFTIIRTSNNLLPELEEDNNGAAPAPGASTSSGNSGMNLLSQFSRIEDSNIHGVFLDWNTDKVELMNNMFQGTFLISPQIETWNTDQVKDMSNMFYNAKNRISNITYKSYGCPPNLMRFHDIHVMSLFSFT